MREIVFRGFTPDEDGKDKAFVNGEWIKGQWVQGSYMKLSKTTYCFKEDYEANPDNTEHYIVFDRMTDWGLPNRHLKADVLPETIGQFVGLTDKNNKKIFEGDIVHAVHKSGYTGIPDKDFGIGVIKYGGTYYGGAAYQIDIIGEPGCRIFSASLQVVIIGNIHSNPELLKGGTE